MIIQTLYLCVSKNHQDGPYMFNIPIGFPLDLVDPLTTLGLFIRAKKQETKCYFILMHQSHVALLKANRNYT